MLRGAARHPARFTHPSARLLLTAAPAAPTPPALAAGKKLAAPISPSEPLRTFLEELTRGAAAVQVGAPRA